MRVDSITRHKPALRKHIFNVVRPKKSVTGFSRSLIVALLGLIFLSGMTILKTQQAQALVSASKGGASNHAGHAIRQPTAMNSDLMAWYPMNGSTSDASGQGHNGTLSNFTFDTTNGWTSGKFGKSLLFGGSQKFMTASDAGLPSGTAPRTLSAWVNVPVLPVNCNTEAAVAYGSNGNGLLNALQLYNCGHGNQIVYAGYNADVTANVTLQTNAWNLLTGTYDGTTASLYLNGSLVASGAKAWNTTLQNINVGRIYNGLSDSSIFNGSIDDVRIYNRLLTASEVGQLYAGSKPINCDQSCALWWKLDEVSGTSAKDSSGNGNTGTLNSFNFDGTTNGWVSAVFSNGLQMNGSNWVSTSGLTTIANVNSPQTLSAWFQSTSSAVQDIITLGNNTGAANQVRINAGNLQVSSSGGGGIINTSVSVADGAWHMVTFTYNGTTARLYLDGKQIDASIIALQSSLTKNVYLGSFGNATQELFLGKLDDARVYTRPLQDYEIFEQYLAGR